MGGITGVITFPTFYLKRGGLSIDDLNELPAALRVKIVIMEGVSWGCQGTWGVLVLIEKSGELE